MGESIVENEIPWTASLMTTAGNLQILTGIQSSTEKLEIYVNAEELFVTAHWVFTASSDLIDKINNNNISIGSDIYFEFVPQTTNNNVNIKLRVLALINGPGVTASTLGTSYSVLMVSPWYFDQYLDSHAYKGTVSSILQSMLNTDLSYSFDNIRISDSIDAPATRWRTLMKQSDFINKRLKKYYLGKNSTSSLIFTNFDNSFDALSYKDMQSLDIYTAIDISSPHINAFQDEITSPTQSQFMIYPTAVSLGINDTEKNNLWDISMPALIYYYRNKQYIKSYNDTPMMSPLGYDKITNFSPVSTIGQSTTTKFSFIDSSRDNAQYTKLYLDESFRNFDDVYASKINEYNRDLQKAHRINLTCAPNLFILAGRICYYYISQQDQTPSIFAQEYIIKEVCHVFRGIKAQTFLTLETTSFDYNSTSVNSNLFNV